MQDGKQFTDYTGNRDYNKFFGIAYKFHQKHNLPQIDAEYWRTHAIHSTDPPVLDLEYWVNVRSEASSILAKYGDDPFLFGLMAEVMTELDRQYEQLKRAQKMNREP